jgi:uncharacterized protein (TIGR03086 family)
MTSGDIRELNRRAVLGSVAIVAGVTPGDLDRATPCAGWTLAGLLAHMIGQHDGFAAAARGEGADLAVWAPRPVRADPAAEYQAAAEHVIAAFAEPDVLDRTFALPEILPGFAFPAPQAISFHFIDYVVHAWDVARSLGVSYDPDADLVQAALPVAQAVPGGSSRLRPGAAFAPAIAPPEDTPRLGQILATLGRSPSWPD